MGNFRTNVRINPSSFPITLKSRVLTVGSCFAEAIGERFQRNKFHTLANPFGIIYNPLSIHKALRYSIHHEPPPAHTYLQQDEINLNYDFHSEFSATGKRELETRISNSIGSAHYFLKDAGWILITYGTSWVYSRNDTGEVVANCHKMPGKLFTKSLLAKKEITESFDEVYRALTALNPGIKIILTLSPVRHIKDTLEGNSVSKAALRVACHNLAANYNAVEYFPAYEMMMDDLRDYRFYKSDMLHPTEVAEDYIWEKFAERYFTSETKNFLKEWKSILSALAHRPFHPNAKAHQSFLMETLKKLEALNDTVDVSREMAFIRKQLR